VAVTTAGFELPLRVAAAPCHMALRRRCPAPRFTEAAASAEAAEGAAKLLRLPVVIVTLPSPFSPSDAFTLVITSGMDTRTV
jgi:hypothetical protein